MFSFFQKKQPQFELGELITIIEGPFTDFTGKIVEIDTIQKKLGISIEIFDGIVEISFQAVEKQQ
jgi:transcription termination/antitermination protein NusG